MKGYRKICTLLCMVLLLHLAAGCVPLQNAAAPASPSPSAPALQYEADPVAWLEQKVAEDTPREKLSTEEIQRLTLLATEISYINLFSQAKELSKAALLYVLYVHYQDAICYDDASGRYMICPGVLYPPDGLDADSDLGVYLLAGKADTFIQNTLGTGIPDNTFDYGNPDDDHILCRQGVYYIYRGDPEFYDLHLRAYQYLGDGVYYLSFDADDRSMAGAPENDVGNTPDYYRLLVVRSNSEWGFTVKAKLKGGDESLLPADFPPPLYAA